MNKEIVISPPSGTSTQTPETDNGPQEPRRSTGGPAKLASILIPCCGQLEYTKLCVSSILRYTRRPYELIFLDIGSLDGTAEFLSGLGMGTHQLRIGFVRTQTDLGIADAIKDAISMARGEYVVLLNNDTIV